MAEEKQRRRQSNQSVAANVDGVKHRRNDPLSSPNEDSVQSHARRGRHVPRQYLSRRNVALQVIKRQVRKSAMADSLALFLINEQKDFHSYLRKVG